MRTFFLDKQDIVRITGERFYRRGYDYFKKGRVHGLTYNPSINSWRGQVRGTETYSVRVFFFEGDELEGSCDCPAYATHFTCKHIAAVLLAIGQDSWSQLGEKKSTSETTYSTPPTIPNDSFSTRIIDAFSKDQQSQSRQKRTLNIEYIIGSRINPHNSKSFLEIELKIGTNKTYVIKNIREFLVHIKKEKPYKITQSFLYEPDIHQFDEEDQKIITNLILAHENESLFENSFSNPLHDKRTIIIPPGFADRLLESISTQKNFYKSYSGETIPGISISDKIDTLTFDLDKDNEQTFNIDVSDLSNYAYLESYGYLFRQGQFFQLRREQQSVMEQLYGLLPYRTGQAHPITNENIESFITNVIPKLEKIGKVNYSKSTQSTIKVDPLQTIIYLDENKGTLLAKVEFHYGDTIIYPYLDEQPTNVVVRREIAKEMEILRDVEAFGFVYINKQFQLFKNDSIYSFINKGMAELKEKSIVFLSETVESMITQEQPTLTSTVDLDNKRGMLDIHFDIGGISKKDVQHVLQAMVEKQQYYRIPNGPLLALEGEDFESFRQLSDQLQLSKKQLEQGQLQVPAARSFQVEEVLSATYFQYSDAFQNLLTELKNPNKLNFTLPESIQAELRDYQLTGFQWFKTLSHYHLGGILADDMGLGKTIQTICYLVSEKEEKPETFSSLIVVPASLLYNWKKEFEKFAPSIKIEIIIGNKEQRKTIIANSQADVYITSYPLLRKDIELYENTHFDVLILDEAQAIKNHLTLTAKAARALNTSKRFALSGTPIENSLDELWSLFHTISPGLFGNKKSFLAFEHEYIAKITRPFIMRRIKKDVLHELPDKIESVQYSDLTKDQKEVYLAYIEKMQQQITETINEKGFEKGKLEILAGLTRLRQICCHPLLFLDNYTGKSGKLEQLKELVHDLQASGKRALVFSQFSSMLTIINQTLQKEQVDTFYLDGSTPSEQRMEMSERFNEGEKSVFLISLKAGGTGLNLTGADTVILYDLWWNPAVEEQAAGRAHRIGQKKVVQVIRLITEGTIEEKIFEMQQKKRELVDQIIQPGETMLSKLSEKEIRELLEMKN
ncbi:serine/threonine protein phosphatase [Aquibacillus halophilus]|uniref:Serine/threonine protein phosphatase n=1 Tax=Aquibacillus halophilus TaxID=930132 RepID=A0A6A8D8R3_9BACI|nr:DEAD/DEAH box helicase [Aquibacillus halophilus]MRH41994.1 serine/threonine protein phosphatase [Aquibacillus halophilus]